MNRDDKIKYLANIYFLLQSDGGVEQIEETVFDGISKEIDAGYFEKKEAKELAKKAGFQPQELERWSDRIRNLEDLLFSAFCNGVVDRAEKTLIQDFASQVGINQQQFTQIKEETRQRFIHFKEHPLQ